MSIEELYGDADRSFRRALAATALAYATCHHLGLLPGGLGSGPSGTQWADWLDLLIPWLVLVPAAVALRAGRVDERVWAVFGAGALAYASGHGIHLAANSVGNVRPGPTAHLWDEVVGHYLWFAGGGTVVFSLVVAIAAVAFGWQHRGHQAGVLWVGFLPAVLVLVGDLVVATQ